MTISTLRRLAAALVLAAGIATPTASAGHEDLGVRHALTSQPQQVLPDRIQAQERARGAAVCGGLPECVAELRTAVPVPETASAGGGGFALGPARAGAGIALVLIGFAGVGALAWRRRTRMLVAR